MMEFTMNSKTFRFKLVAVLVALIIIATPILINTNSVYATKDIGTEGAKEVAVYLGKQVIGYLVNKGIEWAWKTIPTVLTASAAAAVLVFAAAAGITLYALYLTIDGAVEYAINEAGCRMRPGNNYWDCPNRIIG